MPSGAGPTVVRTTGTSVTASEVAVATVTGSWSQAPGQTGVAGNLMSVNVNVTPGTAQTLITLRVRQGANTTTGPLVGIAHPEVTVATVQEDLGFDEFDSTAFAQSGTQQSYTLTIQGNAAGPGTVNQALFELGTTAPVQ